MSKAKIYFITAVIKRAIITTILNTSSDFRFSIAILNKNEIESDISQITRLNNENSENIKNAPSVRIAQHVYIHVKVLFMTVELVVVCC